MMDIEKIKEQIIKKEEQIAKTEERLKKQKEQLQELEQQKEAIRVNELLQAIKEQGLDIEEATNLIGDLKAERSNHN